MTLKGLWAATKLRPNGRPYWYVRRKGLPNVPLPDLPHDDPAFVSAYAAAWATSAPAKAVAAPDGGMGRAILAAAATGHFRGLSDAYRAGLRREWDAMRKDYGHLPVDGLQERHVQADVDKAANPALRLKAWRYLTLPGHPARGARVKATKKTLGHEAWTPDDIDAFRARWPIGTAPRAGMELLLWTACRISDGVRIGRGNVGADGIMAYRQKKTGGMAYVPWVCQMQDYAADWYQDRQMMFDAIAPFGGHVTFFPTKSGRGRSDKALGTMMGDAAEAAGVAKSAHGLRKTRAKMLADAGATTHQIAAWTGHASLKEIEHYTKEADRRRAVSGENRKPLKVRTAESD